MTASTRTSFIGRPGVAGARFRGADLRSSGPAAARVGEDDLYVFVRGTDHGIYGNRLST